MLLRWPEFEVSFSTQPIEIFEGGPRVLVQVLLSEVSTDGGSLQIKGHVDVPVRWEEVVHHDEMDLAAVGYLDAVQAVKLGEERVGVIFYVVVVVSKNSSQEFVLGVMNGLDDVSVVARVIEEAAALSGGGEFGQDVFAS